MSTIFRDKVTVNDFQFNTGIAVDGAFYHIDLMSGWKSSSAPRVSMAEFGYSDGVSSADRFPLKEFYMEFGGWVRTADRLAAETAEDALRHLFRPDNVLRVVRTSPLPRAMDMRAVTEWQVVQDVAEQGFRWLVTVMADYPFKFSPEFLNLVAGAFSGSDYARYYIDSAPYARTYDASGARYYQQEFMDAGSALAVPDSIEFNNEGNADTYGIFTVTGPLLRGEWEVVNETTGEAMSFELDLSSGANLVVNMLDKTATVNGEPVDYFLRGDWIRLVPGVNTLRLSTGEENLDARLGVYATRRTWR